MLSFPKSIDEIDGNSAGTVQRCQMHASAFAALKDSLICSIRTIS